MSKLRWMYVALLLVLVGTVAAQEQGTPMREPPALPATAPKNWIVKRFKIERPTAIYNTWTRKGQKIADLPRGTIVSGSGKLSVIYEPDVVTITTTIPRLGLNTGDTIFRYTYQGEGFADFWIKGRWYKEYDGTFITEADGNGCSKQCSGTVTKAGEKEEWSHVSLQDGREGWFKNY